MASIKDEYTVNCNNHASNLTINLKDLLQRKELVDVMLVADGHLFSAHRLVLSAFSPYFRQMFAQMPVSQQAFVFLKDISEETLEDLMNFIYCGSVSVKQENLEEFFNTAKALDIKGLADRGYTNSTNVESPIFNSFTPAYSCEQFQSIRTTPVPGPVKSDRYEPSHYEPSVNSLDQHNDNVEDINEVNEHNSGHENNDLFYYDDMCNENLMSIHQEYATQDDQWNDDPKFGTEEKPSKTHSSMAKRAKADIDNSEYNTVADIRTNTKGQPNLFVADQKFNRHHRPNKHGQQRWQCTTQRQKKCRAAARTMEVNGAVMMKILCAEHTHE